jgi:hypothetical protein
MAAEQKPKPKTKRRKRSPKQQATELQIEKRRENAAKLKLAGWNMRDIAAHLKCSVGTVHSDIAAVFERTRDTADGALTRAKAISLARLDVATKGIWPSVESGDLDAVDRLVKLEGRRAKLEGLDAPSKTHIDLSLEQEIARVVDVVEQELGSDAAARVLARLAHHSTASAATAGGVREAESGNDGEGAVGATD